MHHVHFMINHFPPISKKLIWKKSINWKVYKDNMRSNSKVNFLKGWTIDTDWIPKYAEFHGKFTEHIDSKYNLKI